jgi:hypothetical protein
MRPKHVVLIASLASLGFAAPYIFILLLWAPLYGAGIAAAFLAPLALVGLAKRTTTFVAFAALVAFLVQATIYKIWDSLSRLGNLEWFELGATLAILAGIATSIFAIAKSDTDADAPALETA